MTSKIFISFRDYRNLPAYDYCYNLDIHTWDGTELIEVQRISKEGFLYRDPNLAICFVPPHQIIGIRLENDEKTR